MTTTATPGLERDYAKIVAGLSERAGHARSEKTATALADALYFEEAAESIEALLATPSPTPAGGEVRALLEVIENARKSIYDWASTAFIAGEDLPAGGMTEAEHKTELYSDLCALSSTMLWLHDEVSKALSVQEPAPSPAVVVDEAMVTLAECPVGLFYSGSELCLKTEYGNNEGRIDAYIVSSGEFFWGAKPQTVASQRAQLVRPTALTKPSQNAGGEQ